MRLFSADPAPLLDENDRGYQMVTTQKKSHSRMAVRALFVGSESNTKDVLRGAGGVAI
jgi:hypothetical protein